MNQSTVTRNAYTLLLNHRRAIVLSAPCLKLMISGLRHQTLSQSTQWCVQPSALVTSRRFSQISQNKVEGFFRLNAKDIVLPEGSYEILTSRGSGPGGQGANCSSNKVELRLRMVHVLEMLDDATYTNLIRQQDGRALTKDGELLIVSAYEHRSALKNKEECISMVKDIIAQASWVPPVEADPIETPDRTIAKHKLERRKKGMMIKMRNAVRQGKW